jgi:hypothetical protein
MSEVAAVSDNDGIQLSDQQKRRQRARSIAIALILAAVAVLFYVITVIKLGPGAAVDRPL